MTEVDSPLYLSTFFSAFNLIEITSEPEFGSFIASEPTLLLLIRPRKYFFFFQISIIESNLVETKIGLCQVRKSQGPVRLDQLFGYHTVFIIAKSQSTELLLDSNAKKAHFSHPLPHVLGEDVLLII